MITVQLVDIPLVRYWWQTAVPLIDKALKQRNARHKYPLEWVLGECLSGRLQLWIVWKNNKVTGVATTRIQHFPGEEAGKFLDVFSTGGWKMHLWIKEMWDSWVKFAGEHNCKTLSASGRAGWIKKAQLMAGKERVKTDTVVTIELE